VLKLGWFCNPLNILIGCYVCCPNVFPPKPLVDVGCDGKWPPVLKVACHWLWL